MCRILIVIIALAFGTAELAAQNASTSTGLRKRSEASAVMTTRGASPKSAAKEEVVSERRKQRMERDLADDSELQWLQVVYRELDLMKHTNGALYYPEEPTEGEDNLFRIILGRMADGSLPAYEFLDGREVFNDANKVKLSDVLERFQVPFTEGKRGAVKIEPLDVPASEVLSYFIIERWEFDKRDGRMRTVVDAVCPVLHRVGDFGGDAIKYPMFWVKYADLRPYLADRMVFTSDDNVASTTSLDDFFTANLYKGDIYKTRNLRNKSLRQLNPDDEAMAHAQDSIEKRLHGFEKGLWVPSLEEVKAQNGEEVAEEKTQKQPARKARKMSRSKAKPSKPAGGSSRKSVSRSVRARK